MKRFIRHIILFSSIVLASIYFILSQADGYSDPFYLKFTTPQQKSLIIGTSKAAQGIIPSVIAENFDIPVYNYSFSINSSPFGPKYLESIKHKLSQKKRDGVFILNVDCWSIASRCTEPNDILSFRENNTCIAEMETVDKNPNLSYLLKYMSGNYYKILHKPAVALLHDDGWLEVSLSMDSISVARRTKSTLLNYKNKQSIYKYSSLRVDYLVKTIDFLNEFGDVYLVRLPVSPKLMAIENDVMPDFNNTINQIVNKTSGYLDLTTTNDLYKYTDGVHLQKESGKKVTEEISKWIRNVEAQQKGTKKGTTVK